MLYVCGDSDIRASIFSEVFLLRRDAFAGVYTQVKIPLRAYRRDESIRGLIVFVGILGTCPYICIYTHTMFLFTYLGWMRRAAIYETFLYTN